MRLALALLAIAATAALLRRRRPVMVPQCDDSDIVGMPTRIRQSGTTASGVPWVIDWDAFFADTKELN